MIAIVIPCRNQIEFTRQCLESIFAGTLGDYSIILIDNECTDGTVEWAMERCEAHRVPLDVIPFVGVNLSACWNLGIEQAKQNRCELAAIINNDVVVGNGWDCGFRQHFRQHRHTWLAVPDCIGSLVDEGFRDEVLARAGRTDFEVLTNWFPGYFMVWRMTAFLAVGTFDEHYRIWYGDTDMRHRLNAADHPAVKLPVPIIHFGSKTTGGVPGHQEIIGQDRAHFRGVYGHE